MIIKLSHPYPSCYKVPIIKYMDDTIFTQHSFCSLDCIFDNCKDLCCYYGEKISKGEISRIIEYKKQIELLVSKPLDDCFSGDFTDDNDYDGGFIRTKVIDGKCVFLSKTKGCILHRLALQNNLNPHALKPITGSLFPINFDYGLLQPAWEILSNLDNCLTHGKTLYQGGRNDLTYYFGKEFINELDFVEHTLPTKE